MKKLLLLICLIFCLTYIEAYAADILKNDFESFETGALSADSLGLVCNVTDSTSVLRIEQESSGNKYLKIKSTTGTPAIYKTMPFDSKYYMNFRIMDNGGKSSVLIRAASASYVAFNFLTMADGVMSSAGQRIQNYTMGQWYDIIAIFDAPNRNLTLYVDGEKKIDKVPMPDDFTTDILDNPNASLRFQSAQTNITGNECTVIDDLYIETMESELIMKSSSVEKNGEKLNLSCSFMSLAEHVQDCTVAVAVLDDNDKVKDIAFLQGAFESFKSYELWFDMPVGMGTKANIIVWDDLNKMNVLYPMQVIDISNQE